MLTLVRRPRLISEPLTAITYRKIAPFGAPGAPQVANMSVALMTCSAGAGTAAGSWSGMVTVSVVEPTLPVEVDAIR